MHNVLGYNKNFSLINISSFTNSLFSVNLLFNIASGMGEWGNGSPCDWNAKATASTIQWANLFGDSLPFLLPSVADKELLRASDAPGA